MNELARITGNNSRLQVLCKALDDPEKGSLSWLNLCSAIPVLILVSKNIYDPITIF